MTGGPRNPDLVSRRINAERVVVAGWTRAILMQLAHPLVAAGVADHSTVRRSGITAVMRLHHKIRAMLALTFGDDRERRAALDGIATIHRRVNGSLRHATGIFPAGTRYSAEDPDLVLWVHATLLETIPLVYDLIVRPLPIAERDAYCAEAAAIACDLGARESDVPQTWQATMTYLQATYRSGAIAVGLDARELSAAVLAPPLGAISAPAAWVNRLLTAGLLPPVLREQYGMDWTHHRARSFDRLVTSLRAARRLAPPMAALWPEARRVSSRREASQ